MIEAFMNKMLELAETVLGWLPRSPFADSQLLSIQDSQGLSWLNWFFPVHDALILTASWVAAIALFYLASILLRWVKAIE